MATETVLDSTRTKYARSFIDKVGPHASKIMIGAAVAGLVAVFLPAVTLTLTLFGNTTTDSIAVWRDWRGKLDLLGYLSVGVMAVLMLRKPDAPSAKKLMMACLIASGVTLLLAVWLPLSIRGSSSVPKELGSLSIGLGCYVNILASLVLVAASVLQAKRMNVLGGR